MENILIKKDAPDFRFSLFYKENDKILSDIIKWDSKSGHLRSVGSINTVFEMNELMSKSMKIIDPTMCFEPDFPEFLVSKSHIDGKLNPKVITWGTVRKEPGTVSGTPFRGTQEIKPRIRESIAIFTPSTSNYLNIISTELAKYVRIKAQVFDNLIQYNCWSRSNYQVEELLDWFELYMERYRGMFREAGVNDIVFNRQVRDDSLTQLNKHYHVRSVLYYVRTERIFIDTISPITRIDLNIDVNDLQKKIINLEDHSIDTNLYSNIINKWVNK